MKIASTNKNLCKLVCKKLVLCVLIITTFAIWAKAQSPVLNYTPILQNLSKPIDVVNAADGSGRLFIAEQTGQIKIYKNGVLNAKPFLDISNLVLTGMYKGIMSLAFSPNYKKDKAFFVYYIDVNNKTTIARYKTSKNNPDSAVANSGVKLFSLDPVDTGDTKISLGDMHFGKDKYLYITISDGSYIDNVTNLAQNGNLLFGKMLRINPFLATAPYYTIPPNNPYVNNPDVLDEIWAIGFRNAWRFSFDKITQNMWIGDDGNSNRDEIDFRKPNDPGGVNYGWKCYEGTQPFDLNGCLDSSNYVFPIFDIEHDSITGAFAIIGGYVYRGTKYPSLKGTYICSDYITGNAWKIKPNTLSGGWTVYRQSAVPTGMVSYGEGEDGELYSIGKTGIIYSVSATTSAINTFVENNNVTAANTIAATRIYPTMVTGNSININFKESYQYLRIINIAGNEVIRQELNGAYGELKINLPHLTAGMYIVQLIGTKNMQQKIYVQQ
jgi:glucose/arabinose dehydrogenase